MTGKRVSRCATAGTVSDITSSHDREVGVLVVKLSSTAVYRQGSCPGRCFNIAAGRIDILKKTNLACAPDGPNLK